MAQILAAALFPEGNGLASGVGLLGAAVVTLVALFHRRAPLSTKRTVSIAVRTMESRCAGPRPVIDPLRMGDAGNRAARRLFDG